MVDTAKVPLNKDSLVPGALIREQDQLRQLLISSKRSDQIKNLYDHIVDVMDFLVIHYPHDAITKFEEVSYLIKTGDEAKLRQFLKTQESKRYAAHSDHSAIITKKYLDRVDAMTKSTSTKAEVPAEEEGQENEALAPVCYMPDLIQDNKSLYQWAGINFGETQCMLLQKSMQNLGKSSGATKLRFWGKVTGTEKDYFICEGSAEAAAPTDDEQRPADLEARGVGVNEFAYWICNCPTENKWTALPDLSPQDVEIARKVKVSFSGDLERRIITNPFMHKREKFLLRAQIARISCSTAIVPKGMFRPIEESPQEIEENANDDGPAPIPTVTNMCNMNMWVHHTKSILKCARTTVLEQEAPEGVEDVEAWQKAQQALDPQESRLKSITEDKACKGNAPAWCIRAHGDMTNYNPANPIVSKLNFGVVVVKSCTWPGATTFFTQQKQQQQVYLGDGLKFEAQTFYPVHTPKMQADPIEKLTYAEPNPTASAIERAEAQKALAAAGGGAQEDD